MRRDIDSRDFMYVGPYGKAYLVASILMGVAGVLVLFSRSYLASSAMLVASGLAFENYRLRKKQ